MPESSSRSNDWREERRFRAWSLYQQGWSQTRVPRELGVSRSVVSRWLKQGKEGGGAQALKRYPAPGKQPRLSEAQFQQIP